MKRVAGVILAGFLSGVAPAPLQQPSPSGGDTQTERQETPAPKTRDLYAKDRGTESAPLFVQIAQPEGHEAIATKSQEAGHWYESPDWWVAGFTGALFAATTGLWFATWLLWRATKGLVQEEQANRKIELRAYLSAKVRAIKLEGQILRAYVSVQNDGQSPAFNVKIPAVWETKAPPPHTFLVSEAGESGAVIAGLSPFTLSKGGSSTLSPKAMIPDIPAFRDKVATLGSRFYVYGLITYLDVFGDTQWVEFCEFLESAAFLVAFDRAQASPGVLVEAAFQVPSFGNEASFSPDHAEAMEKYRKSAEGR
jgi:hypothetical protein